MQALTWAHMYMCKPGTVFSTGKGQMPELSVRDHALQDAKRPGLWFSQKERESLQQLPLAHRHVRRALVLDI